MRDSFEILRQLGAVKLVTQSTNLIFNVAYKQRTATSVTIQ